MPQSSSVGGEKRSKGRSSSPGLSYAGGGGSISGQIPKIIYTQTKLPEEETDSVMTEKHTTQGQKQGDQNTQSAQEEMGPGRNHAQQLANTAPTSNGANNWANPNSNSIDWGSFDYYNWAMPMMYRGNNPWKQDKGKQRGGHLSGWTNRNTSRQDQAGEVYARSDWALRTNERSVAKQMHPLGGVSRYSEWENGAKRRPETLYNHPVSSDVRYFIVNLRSSSERTDKEQSGNLRHNLKIKVDGGGESVNNKAGFSPVSGESVLYISRSRSYEPAGKR